MQELYKKLPGALLPWYEINKRQLPWREDKDPYHIWISEIMLQQTRVEAVKGYYRRFLQALPTVQALADAQQEQLYKLWEGLGYYNRVRNLQKAARVIVDRYAGVFPGEYEQVLALPGIGAYTAGAICSIAFDIPVPAVDGNVLRVAARLTNDPTPIETPAFKKTLWQQLKAIYPTQAGMFTQALMELGATVCGPNRKPDCENCPCRGFCLACQKGTAEQLPVRLPKKKRKTEERTVFIISCDGAYALQKRPQTGLLANLWEFPNVFGKLSAEQAVSYLEETGVKIKEIRMQVEKKHIFTHIEWDMNGIYVESSEKDDAYFWADGIKLREDAALPTAFRQFLEGIENV